MHIVNSCANVAQHTENNQCVKSGNYHLNSSAWSSLSTLISLSLLMIICEESTARLLTLNSCAFHLHGKQFPSILNKTISEFVIPLLVGIRLFYLESVKNTVKI